MPKISIIVPVYNVQNYLDSCIQSILNQTFKDFEVILVNDGSTDKSGAICNEYSKKYSKVKVIHKQNGGQGDARNEGIKIAKGDYIGFVDSDDVIEDSMYEILYNMCIKNDADVSTCLLTSIEEGITNNKIYSGKISIYSNKEAIKETYNGGISGYSPCNKLYNRILFENIKFPVGRIYEDASVLYKLYMNSNKIIFIESALYKYMRREGSTTNRPVSHKRFDIVDMFEEKYDFMEQNYPEMCEKIKSMYYISLRNIIVDIVNEGNVFKKYKYINKSSKLIRQNLKHILNNKLISKKHKVLAIALSYTPILPVCIYKRASI